MDPATLASLDARSSSGLTSGLTSGFMSVSTGISSTGAGTGTGTGGNTSISSLGEGFTSGSSGFTSGLVGSRSGSGSTVGGAVSAGGAGTRIRRRRRRLRGRGRSRSRRGIAGELVRCGRGRLGLASARRNHGGRARRMCRGRAAPARLRGRRGPRCGGLDGVQLESIHRASVGRREHDLASGGRYRERVLVERGRVRPGNEGRADSLYDTRQWDRQPAERERRNGHAGDEDEQQTFDAPAEGETPSGARRGEVSRRRSHDPWRSDSASRNVGLEARDDLPPEG